MIMKSSQEEPNNTQILAEAYIHCIDGLKAYIHCIDGLKAQGL